MLIQMLSVSFQNTKSTDVNLSIQFMILLLIANVIVVLIVNLIVITIIDFVIAIVNMFLIWSWLKFWSWYYNYCDCNCEYINQGEMIISLTVM